MRIVAIIPARSGSKGIKDKNLRPLCGKPLVAWSIEQALDAEQVDAVYVTTDSQRIAAVAQSYGVAVIERPAALATDTATTDSTLRHALATTGEDVDFCVLLQPTSPIRQPGDIDAAISTCIESQADSLFSARRLEGFSWTEGLSRWIPSYTPHDRPRRQDLASKVEENGNIYVFRPAVLDQYEGRLGGKVAVYLQHPLDSFQIDTPDDLDMFDQLLPVRLGSEAEKLNEYTYRVKCVNADEAVSRRGIPKVGRPFPGSAGWKYSKVTAQPRGDIGDNIWDVCVEAAKEC